MISARVRLLCRCDKCRILSPTDEARRCTADACQVGASSELFRKQILYIAVSVAAGATLPGHRAADQPALGSAVWACDRKHHLSATWRLHSLYSERPSPTTEYSFCLSCSFSPSRFLRSSRYSGGVRPNPHRKLRSACLGVWRRRATAITLLCNLADRTDGGIALRFNGRVVTSVTVQK